MNLLSLKPHLQIVILFFVLAFSFPSTAQALVVNFEAIPLFSDADVKPGDNTTRTVVVENDTSEPQPVYAASTNIFSTGLADVMQLQVTDGTNTLFDGLFTDFFNTSPVALGLLSAGDNQTYFFTASIPAGVGNAYQLTTFGFDLIIGFEGGASTTDGGGGGGGGSSSSLFSIFNEDVASVSVAGGSAVITWNTSSNATSYLVCGNINDGPFILNPSDSQFGYPLVVAEIDTQTTIHSLEISGLALGTYECRPASRKNTSDDFSVGDVVQFTLALPGLVAGVTDSPDIGRVPVGTQRGEVRGAGVSVDEEATPTEDEVIDDEPETIIERTVGEFADALTVLGKDHCLFIWLMLLAVYTLLWSIIDDFIRNRTRAHKRWLLRNTAFALVFAVLVWLTRETVFLQTFWWLFVVVWTGVTIFDYRKHTENELWSGRLRNAFFTLLSVLFIITSFWFGLPCVWWPFVIIGVVSAVGWIVSSRTEETN